MDKTNISQMFMYAVEQARAVKTLYAFKCIPTPEYIAALTVARKHLREILCGSVPCINSSGKVEFFEDKPECVEAFRTILMNKASYDRLIESAVESQFDFAHLIETHAEKEKENECCNHQRESLTVLPATEGIEGVNVSSDSVK